MYVEGGCYRFYTNLLEHDIRGRSSKNDKAALRLKEYDFTLGPGVTRGNYICATS